MINKRYWVEESYLTSMADVIRNKTGKTDKILFPDGFFDEIANIETTPATALPVLDSNYPEDVTVIEGANVSASFSVIIAEPGIPAIYTYQWYENGNPIEGATSSIYNKTTDFVVGNYSIYCEITNEAGTVISRIANFTIESYLPTYTYTGNLSLIEDENYNWRIKFLTSGTLCFQKLNSLVDFFAVGGGGGGGQSDMSGGGAGGKTLTLNSIALETEKEYVITIGGGGGAGATGGTTTAFGHSVAGGGGGGTGRGGDSGYAGRGGGGGSGGGGGGYKGNAGNGGSDGGSGSGGYLGSAGGGQGTTTREFGDADGDLYAGGGGGGAYPSWAVPGKGGSGGGGNGANGAGASGTVNTGGGGGGGDTGGGTGGSGIVVIRNHR